ncbi:MAG: TRAP transporter large permease [Burkholderiales bacterium]
MYITGIVALVLLVLSVPIGIALSAASAAYIFVDPLLEPSVIFRAFFSFIGRYSLMAIPLFIFAGFLMERTGLVGQLFRFADSLVGWMPGGFGVATVLACVLFGAISGSSVAMAAAMSVIAIPEMLKRGYPPWLAAGLVATAGGIAMLIPPSIILLLYGIVTETSVARLFFAGIIPGLMLALGNIITVVLIAIYLKLPRSTFDRRRIWPETMKALPALGMPVVILGGLYGGLFTPTEAAAAACGYAMVYGLITGRGEFVKQLLPVAARSLNLTAVILFLVGSVGVFQFLAANLYWPQKITQAIVEWGLTPLGFIFAFMGVLLILGCLVDGVAMVLLTVPVVFPVAMALKIDPIQLGIIITLNVETGVVTPPVGLNLFAVSGTSKIPLTQVLKGTIPFFIGDLTVLVLCILFPGLSTWLPDLLIKDVFK